VRSAETTFTFARDFRRGVLVERRKLQDRRLSGMDMINLLRCDLHLHCQRIGVRRRMIPTFADYGFEANADP
jgi:hypothetical protein